MKSTSTERGSNCASDSNEWVHFVEMIRPASVPQKRKKTMSDPASTISFKVENKEFWSEFLDMYKNLPELWDTRLDIYKDRILKKDGYDKLVTKLKELNPAADRDEARRKINAFRTNYRRELKKKITNENGHSSSLWYYDKLDFLATLDQERGSYIDSGAEEDHIMMPIDTTMIAIPKKRKRIAIENHQNKVSKEEIEAKRIRDNDEAEILSKSWALQYKQMSDTQKIFARKAISDILFEGCLGSLNRENVQTTIDPTCTQYLVKNEENTNYDSSNECD